MVNIKKYMLYLYAFVCFFQARFLTIETPGFQLSIGRICFLVFFLAMFVGKLRVPKDYLYVYLGIWFVYQVMNIINGVRFGFGNWMLLTYFVGIYLVLAITIKEVITDLKGYKTLLVCLNCGILIQAVIGLFEHFTGIYFWTSSKELFSTVIYYMNKKFPCAMQENPNDFAFLMMVGIVISLILINKSKSKFIKVLWTATIVCEVYLIYVAESRGVMLGLIMGAVYVILANFLNNKQHSKKQVLLVTVAITGLLLVGVLNLEKFITELSSHFDFSGGNTTRINLIAKGLESIFETFGLGYASHDVAAWHNHYIEILADFGIIIFIMLLRFYYLLFKRLKKVARNNSELNYVCLLIRGFLISLIIAVVSPASILRIEWFGAIIATIVAFEHRCLYMESKEMSN